MLHRDLQLCGFEAVVELTFAGLYGRQSHLIGTLYLTLFKGSGHAQTILSTRWSTNRSRMAATTSRTTPLKRSLEEEIRCPLCLSIFTDPRRLPCEHVFCAKCLEAVIGKSRSRSRSRSRFRKLTCPVCRGEHQLSENEFPKACQVNRLIEMYKGMAASSTKRVRSENKESVCCAIHITQPLALYCKTCKSNVCRDCALLVCSKANHMYDFKEDVLKKYAEELDERISLKLEAMKSAEQALVHRKTEKIRCVDAEVDIAIDILQQVKKQQISEIEDHFDRQMSRSKLQEEEMLSAAGELKNLLSDETLHSGKTVLDNYEKVAEIVLKLKEFALRYEQPLHHLLEDVDVKVEVPVKWRKVVSRNISVCMQVGGSCVCLEDGNFSQCELLNMGKLFQADFITRIFPKMKIYAKLVNILDGSSQVVSVSQISPHTLRLAVTPLKRGRHKLYIQHGSIDVRGSPVSCTVAVSPLYFHLVTNPLRITTLKDPIGVKCHEGLVYVFECGKGITSMSNAQDGLKVVKTIPTEMVGELLLHHDNIYITDSKTDCVKLLHYENLEERVSIGGKGSQRNLFSCPNGIRMSKNGEIYICDSSNNRIKVFDENLGLKRIFGTEGSGPGQFKFPTDLEFDRDGNIYVVEFGNHRVQVLSAQEEHIRNIGEGSAALCSPITAAMYQGFVFVTSYTGNCVCVFTEEGEFVTSFGHNILDNPESIAIDQDGYVFVINDDELLRF